MLGNAFRHVIGASVCLGVMAVYGGCAGTPEEIAKKIKLTINEQTETADIQIFLNNNASMDFQGEIPVSNYGTIEFVPGNGEFPPSLIIKVSYSNYHDELPVQIGVTSKLPPGEPMPPAVVAPLFFLKLPPQTGYTPVFYLSIKPDIQVGAAAVIRAMMFGFPPGIVLSQNFRSKQGVPLAVVSVFGPRRSSPLVAGVPGGFFFCINITRIQHINDPIVVGPPPVDPPSGGKNIATASQLAPSRAREPIIEMTLDTYDTELYDPDHTAGRGLEPLSP